MIRVRFAGGLLAVGAVAASVACAPTAERVTGRVPVAEPVTGRTPVAAVVSQPPSETLSPLLEQALPNVEGKTFTSAIVSFPPAARAAPHRHGDAFVYAYVIEGTVRSRLGGEPARTYHAGENWVEQPGAHHLLTENTSRTRPAKLLVVFVSDTGDRLKVDDPPR
ncbi:cupin domain-containing protein [Streptosporangium sp. NPDC048047]|uniref:cupin domain-containing protein n=1 Tax=Streptosporangium sp. NPDC048047 TaxID=3155748 RepID=UPI003434BAF1